MASERTAAQYGKVGEVRRDPMAMLPFCGYNMADYFAHWLAIGKKLAHPPKIFHVNWFRVNEHGNFIWPGFGENIRVIEWILRRCQGLKEAVKTPIGFIPAVSNLDLAGLQLTEEQLKQLFLINPDEWDEELKGQYQFLNLFGSRMPKELLEEHAQLKARFLAQ
jgi:phosphoenolpyruvate carboxykinase (GTP)